MNGLCDDACVAIIPARGGSKGLARKNLAKLGGRPLVSWTIAAALECVEIDRVIVTTEDREIADVADAVGAEVIERPERLATDEARIEDVVVHVLQQLDGLPKWFALLQPTSPLRDADEITSAVELARASRPGAVFAVCPSLHHPHKALVVKHGQLKPVDTPSALSAPRQSLPAAVRQTGATYVVDTERFLHTRSLFVEPVVPLLVSDEHATIDIDTPNDLAITARLLGARE